MQTITIMGENLSQQAIGAFSAMAQAMTPKYQIKYINTLEPKELEVPTENRLSKEDAKYLKAVVAKAQSGELKTYTSQEFEAKMTEKGFLW
ncbi:hypothetical protein [Campylobacter fetus]|uniref:hypothetical protein n=1 Tax=Campylobacter fetus TaxID=196 RepID=UPI0003E3EFE7|nr:hypothetical protein [Campylobacter fetus]CDF65970.1 hypothetical protein CSG_c690 [Campylobacter fetus subsp. venerealis str. 84-112]